MLAARSDLGLKIFSTCQPSALATRDEYPHPVQERAQARPEAAAVLAEDAAPLTYGELNAGSNRLAHMPRELGCRRGDRVVLLMPKSPEAIMSLIGVLKADAAYVPLDPAGPAPRLARMLEVCGCHSILAAGSAAPIANGKADRPELRRRFLEAEAQSCARTPRRASGPVLT